MLTRRELMVGAASAWAMACAKQGVVGAVVERPDPDDARELLRDAVARLSRYGAASGFAAIATESRAAVDGADRVSVQGHRASAVLSLAAAGRRREAAVLELSRPALDRAIAELSAGATAQRRNRFQAARPETIQHSLANDPRKSPKTAWLTRASQLAEVARAVGSSRLVYRSVAVETSDVESIFIASGIDLAERRVRSRARFATVGWLGDVASAARAEHATSDGVETVILSEQALATAAAHALELATPGDAIAGPSALVLTPPVVSALVRAGLVEAVTGRRWARGPLTAHRDQPIASELVTIADDPSAPSLGAYAFDDSGTRATAVTLVERGRCKSPLASPAEAAQLGVAATPHARRAWSTGPLRSSASCLAIAAGASASEELLDQVGDGYLLEEPRTVRVDQHRWQLAFEVGRARRFERGARTGHVHRDVEVRADLAALLKGVRLASRDVQTIDERDDATGLWRTTSAPWWLTAGVIASGGSR